jgi:hypothetical protein
MSDDRLRPTPDDMGRDGGADLAVCDAATPPPWEATCPRVNWRIRRPDGVYVLEAGMTGVRTAADAAFIALARAALPAWVRRALSAEANAAHFALKYEAALGRAHAAEDRVKALEARVTELEAAR